MNGPSRLLDRLEVRVARSTEVRDHEQTEQTERTERADLELVERKRGREEGQSNKS